MAISDRPVISAVNYKEDGTALLIGSLGEQVGSDLEQAVAKAQATGAVGKVHGYVATAATSIVSVRATAYTEQTAALQREVVSSSASDSSAGTGTRTIRITYYDATMAGPFTVDVTMNGTTPVSTSVSNIAFVEKIETLTVGSNGTNVGTITLRLLSAGATIGTIAVSDGITFWAHHYVGVGRTCFVQRVITGVLGVSGAVFLRKTFPLVANSFENQITTSLRTITAQPSQTYDFSKGLLIAGPARVTAYVRPDANTAATWQTGFTFFDV